MTIATTTNRVDAPGNGSATSFSFAPVVIFEASDLQVTVRDSGGNETTLTQGAGSTNYSVTVSSYPGVGSITYPASGGTPLASGSTIVIKRIVPLLQSVSLSNQGAYFPKIQEGEFDYLTAIDQQQQEELSRAIVGPPNGPSLSYVLPAAPFRANSILGFDAVGNVAIYPPGTTPSGTTASNVSYLAGYTGAVARTVADKLGDFVSVRDFGATGNGTADDTASIQEAANSGKAMVFPNGTYKVSGTIALSTNNQMVFGEGVGSNIVTNSATLPIFSITGQLVHMSDLQLNSSVTRTAGGANVFIDIVNTGYFHLHDVLIQNFASGIRMSGSQVAGIRIYDITMNLGHDGVAIEVSGGGLDVVISDVLISGTAAGTQLLTGVAVLNCGDVTLRHVSTVYAGNGLSVAPGVGQVVQAVFVEHCLFDTGSGAGIDVEATGVVQLIKLSDTWSCSNVAGGIILNTHGSGAIQQADITACTGSNNGNHGLLINTAGVTGTTVLGGSYSANAGSGILISAGCTFFKIIGTTAGICGEFAGNVGYGIGVGAGCDNFVIADNILLSNGTGSVAWAAPGGTYGVSWRVHDNIGFHTEASGILVTTAGPTSFAITHGLPTTPALTDVQLTLMSGIGSAANFWPTTPGATTFPIVFNSAPGASVSVGWKISMFGG